MGSNELRSHVAGGRLKVGPFRCLPTQEGATYGRCGQFRGRVRRGPGETAEEA